MSNTTNLLAEADRKRLNQDQLADVHISRELSDPPLTASGQVLSGHSFFAAAAAIIGVQGDPLSLMLHSVINYVKGFLPDQSDVKEFEPAPLIQDSTEMAADQVYCLLKQAYEIYQKGHSFKDSPSELQTFITHISVSIDSGYEEAMDILDGLGLLEGKLAKELDRAYDLFHERLIAFACEMSDS